MHRLHAGFTIALPVKKFEVNNLKSLLDKYRKDNVLKKLKRSKTILNANITMLPSQQYGEECLPETLLIATTYVGPLKNHLKELVQTCKIELVSMLSCCEQFNNPVFVSDYFIARYLQDNKVFSAFNSRFNCLTKLDIRRERRLRLEIEKYLDKAQNLGAFTHLSAVQIKSLIQRHIFVQGEKYEWTYKPAIKNLYESIVLNRTEISAGFSFMMFLYAVYKSQKSISILPLSILSVLTLLHLGSTGVNETNCRPDDQYVRTINATQLNPVLNEMTAAGPLKKGWLRRYVYAAILRVTALFAPRVMQVPTVSTIRWLTINNRKRLVFLSCYSNTTDFYVRDFLNGNTPRGVNLMFSNGQGFPDSKLMFIGGIRKDPEGFMHAVHSGQHVTNLTYIHEPSLTSDIINKNRLIRNGLFKPMNEQEATQWLRLL